MSMNSNKKKKKSSDLVRIRILFSFIILIGVVLTGKLYLVQIVHGEVYSQRADRQYVRPNQNVYNRGDIYFTQKDGSIIPAATLEAGFTVALRPDDVVDSDYLYSQLSEYSDLSKEEFIKRAEKEDDPYEVVAEKILPDQALEIEEKNIDGVNLYSQRWRFYPGEDMAGHTIGVVGYGDGDVQSGRYGLERYYEDTLKRSNSQVYVNFFAEVFSNIKETLFQDPSLNGDIITGIEPNLQAQLEEEISSLSDRWGSKESGAIIMDPKTGQIYAMAAYPSLNLNNRNEFDSSDLRNPLVENVYEFGSIMKPITMAIGIDTNTITPESTYVDEGSVTLDGYTIENYDGRARGKSSMQDVLNYSLNTGSAYVANLVGNERFRDFMFDFGFGDKSGIDLPSESSGLVGNLETARDIEIANASFGQGVAVSPIGITRALAVLANGGKLIKPYVAETVSFDTGESKSLISKDGGKQVISSSTSETITRMLVKVVDEILANGAVGGGRHAIAAKTGTAQIPTKGERGYYKDRYLHSFFGYVPAYEPRFIIFLYTVEPGQGVQYASQTLTDPFMNMVNFLINYYNLPPDR